MNSALNHRRLGWGVAAAVLLGRLLMALALGGCSNESSATPTPTKTARPPDTATPVPTATPTALPSPTASPTTVPTDTPPPAFTPTQEPSAQNDPDPTPTATPTKVTWLIDPSTSADINPLTGLKVAEPAVLERPPLAIKVSNYPDIVRPQAGLDKADVIFEHYAEGNLTRFTAIFLGRDAEKVGSVRSGRLLDIEIAGMFRSIFAFSGASAGVQDRYRVSEVFGQIVSPDFGHAIGNQGSAPFYRIPQEGKAIEHTLFTDTPTLWQFAADRLGYSGRQLTESWVFAQAPPLLGQPISQISIPYSVGTIVSEYAYDAGQGYYLRSVNGQPHREELSGQQLHFANVIVIYANHVETDIQEDTWGGGHFSIQIQLWGQGPVRVFRDGKMIDGFWQRDGLWNLVQFVDGNGQPIPLKPGNSFIQMVPLGFEIDINP